jgi:hypothetical protein
MPQISRAISIRQPYAELILRGEKKIEYRSRRINIRERVYIYAGLRPGDSDDWVDLRLSPGDLPVGVIVGTIEIVGCRGNEASGEYEWLLARPKRLRKQLRPVNQPQPGIWRPQF